MRKNYENSKLVEEKYKPKTSEWKLKEIRSGSRIKSDRNLENI